MDSSIRSWNNEEGIIKKFILLVPMNQVWLFYKNLKKLMLADLTPFIRPSVYGYENLIVSDILSG